MRGAFTLPELVLVLAVLGILSGLAVPPLAKALDRIEVRAASHLIVAAHQRARSMAITRGQVLVLSVGPDQLVLRRQGHTIPIWSRPGPSVHGVMLEGAGHSFVFSPEGITMGLSNATLRLSRGSATRLVIVSRLGRVRVAS